MKKYEEQMRKQAEFPSPYGVSFILICTCLYIAWNITSSFPSPYGVSFILMSSKDSTYSIITISFRLLMEYHSFLLNNNVKLYAVVFGFEFPSPYGVSFILILWLKKSFITISF